MLFTCNFKKNLRNMKTLLFVLAMLPFVCIAQDDPNQKHDDGTLEFVQAAKSFTQPAVRKENSPRKLKDDQVYTGNVKFTIGSNDIISDSAIVYTNENVMMAFNVKITNPQSFDIIGDILNYNKEDNTALLTGNATVTAKNGNVVGTSASLRFDFSYDIYHIIDGAITPQKK
jgi:lipopolysaccharide export system protein LptA